MVLLSDGYLRKKWHTPSAEIYVLVSFDVRTAGDESALVGSLKSLFVKLATSMNYTCMQYGLY